MVDKNGEVAALSLAALLESAVWEGASFSVAIPSSWSQGRTAYGGLSAALALEAARRITADLPPLRSAQIAFIGPLGGKVQVSATLLRRGRSSAYIQADVMGENGLGLRAIFLFMAAQSSSVDVTRHPIPDVPPPGAKPLEFPVEQRPAFTENFDYQPAIFWQASDGTPRSDFAFWVRLRDGRDIDPSVGLLALADALPPAAMPLARRPGPTSSANWTINFMQHPPVTTDGWWLLRSTLQNAVDGNSSQQMGIWNRDGLPVAAGMQHVALFF
ncbi:thioesterase family protein [Niveispirillum sp. SYP-B3756]|uniref:thioesterase family protein n=1 Tax=Niveispirillum sp. SYP-B3756 TaxID=2662178 RepID=UPI0012913A76|nr:thioesterase family protein [Niveispirillum sp. SYP-B3756]MQP66515.1 thioesterase family protein [Niveispirillum sp. SYP-B3756]